MAKLVLILRRKYPDLSERADTRTFESNRMHVFP